MPELFANISALTVFLIIAGVGLVFLVAALLFGEIFDHVGVEVDGGVDGHGFLDTRVVSVFITSFGGFGAIGIQSGLSVLTSSLLGLASGIVLGGLVTLFGRFLVQPAGDELGWQCAQLVGPHGADHRHHSRRRHRAD